MIIKPTEWINKPDENGDGLLEAWAANDAAEFPIPIETHNVSAEDVRIGEEQDFEFIFECAEMPDIYENETEYEKQKGHFNMASESVIPIGLFPANDDKDFVKTARILLVGRVTETYNNPTDYGFNEGDVLFTVACLGNEYDAVLSGDISDTVAIMPGNIVAGTYWVQGWPAEE